MQNEKSHYVRGKVWTNKINIHKIMTDQERHKLEESLRFHLERILWKVEIDNQKKIQSFTVKMDNGSVKSVIVKVDK